MNNRVCFMTQNNSDSVTKRGVPSLDKHKLSNVGIFEESQCQKRIWTFPCYEVWGILIFQITSNMPKHDN